MDIEIIDVKQSSNSRQLRRETIKPSEFSSQKSYMAQRASLDDLDINRETQ
jgi:hypothetical protein